MASIEGEIIDPYAPLAYINLTPGPPMAYGSVMEIVRTSPYLRTLKKLGASKFDIEAMEGAIIADPEAGEVIQGTGGVRKVRFGMAGRGKRGGGRAIYFVWWSKDVVFMLAAYAKADQSDLSDDQKKALTALVKELTQ